MTDRLFVAVIGERNSGKSTTWNTLFGRRVKTGKWPRRLTVHDEDSAQVRLISGSNEERRLTLSEVVARSQARDEYRD